MILIRNAVSNIFKYHLFFVQDGDIDFREFMTVLYIMSSGTLEDNL